MSPTSKIVLLAVVEEFQLAVGIVDGVIVLVGDKIGLRGRHRELVLLLWVSDTQCVNEAPVTSRSLMPLARFTHLTPPM
jgi:hypothetical protein